MALQRRGGINLTGAHLEGAVLGRVHLEGAFLAGAHLERAFLWDAHLERVNLTEAHLERAYLWQTHLEGADLRGAHLEGAQFHSVALDRTLMTRECFGRGISEENSGERVWARDAYLSIKQNFASLGRYDDALWVYIKERQMERKAARANRRWSIWARNAFFEALCDYGENIRKALDAALAVIAFAPYFYWVAGILGGGVRTDSGGRADLPQSFLFSLRTFATMTGGGLEPADGLAMLASSIEAILGVCLAALLMYCLGRRMSGR